MHTQHVFLSAQYV